MEETMSQHFSAPMGKTTIQMTVIASIVLLFVGGLQLAFGFKAAGNVRRILLCVGSLILVCLPASFLLKVRGYEITGSHVLVHYGLSTRSFPLAGIQRVARQPNALRGSTRTAGNGGLWSFLGWFSNRELGTVRAYVSDLERTVVINLPEYAVVVSPSDPDQFVKAIQKHKGGAPG